MTELEQQTIRVELMEIINKCQSVLLRMGAAVPEQVATPIKYKRGPHSRGTSAKVRKWIKEHQKELVSGFCTIQIKNGVLDAYPDANGNVVSATLRNMVSSGELESVTRMGRGSPVPNTYRILKLKGD